MSSLNQVTIIGNLGADAEMRTTASGKNVTNLRIATSYGERTDWHRVVCFDKAAEFAALLKKGERAAIVGRISYREWEKDGVKQWSTEIVANTVLGCSVKSERQAGEAAPVQKDEQIPF